MKRSEAEALCEQLDRVVTKGPGDNPSGLNQVRAIAEQFERASDHRYVREKLRKVVRDFELWFSPRKWKRYGPDGSRLRDRLYAHLHELRGGMETFENEERGSANDGGA